MNIDEKRREALRRRVELFRDGKPTEGTVKRRKNTRRILLINIGLLVAIFSLTETFHQGSTLPAP